MLRNADRAAQLSLITSKRRILALKAAGIGLVAGLAAVGFRLCLEWAEEIRGAFVSFGAARGGAYVLLPSLVFGLVVAGVALFTRQFAPDAGGSGIPHLKGYLGGDSSFRAWRILFVKFWGGLLGIGSGLALGREGPTVQMGAAVAKIISDRTSATPMERKVLISAGAGAGLAAAFNAPMAGLFFVLEELHSSFHQAVLITAFVASVTADIVCRLIVGRLPVFHIRISSYPELRLFPYFMVLGVVIGFLGLLFNKSLLQASDYVRERPLSKRLLVAFGLGVTFGIVVFWAPESLGTGGELISRALSSKMLMVSIVFYFFLRLAFTALSYSTGAPGGIFAPLLLLGVLSGTFFGDIVASLSPKATFDYSAWAVLGMAGFFAAVVRAPITGTVLILEMTGAYDLLLPLMVVSIISYSIPEYYRDEPIYEALLKRDLRGAAQSESSVATPNSSG